jgi:hypothetical protein
MWNLFVHAAWQVAVYGLILGAALPALFAVGVRSTVLANSAQNGAASSIGVSSSVPSTLNRVIGVVCFVLVVAAVAIGITVIIAAGLGKEVSFEHIYPTIVPKS